MKVDKNVINQVNANQADMLTQVDSSKAARTQAQQTENMGGKDRATLSREAQLLSRAMAAFDGTSEVRSEKVEALRAQILSGEYQIPYQELARRLSLKLGL